MPNYQQGKIYKIISPHTDKIYIGSTTKQYLSQRLSKHKYAFKKQNLTSYKILEFGDVEIILLESYPCNSKDELIARERYWMDQSINLINKNRPVITEEERKNRKKQNVEKNKEHYDSYRKINHKCECGCMYYYPNKSRHIKSDKHQTYLMIQNL
jgi:hypothetical protein